MKNWLIKILGGHTHEDYAALRARYDAIPAVWNDAVAALKQQGKVTIIENFGPLVQPHIEGALIVAPRSHAALFGGYSETTYLPVDSEGRVH